MLERKPTTLLDLDAAARQSGPTSWRPSRIGAGTYFSSRTLTAEERGV